MKIQNLGSVLYETGIAVGAIVGTMRLCRIKEHNPSFSGRCYVICTCWRAWWASSNNHFSGYTTQLTLSCCYLAYGLSLRNLEEMMLERGIAVNHSTIHRWVLRLSPLSVKVSKKHRTIYGDGTRYVDETYIKVKGKWTDLYRAVNANGDTLDFMLSRHRSKKSALKFSRESLHQNGSPHTINIDKSKANTASLVTLTQPYCFTFKIRQCRDKNNIVKKDHRFIKKCCQLDAGIQKF